MNELFCNCETCFFGIQNVVGPWIDNSNDHISIHFHNVGIFGMLFVTNVKDSLWLERRVSFRSVFSKDG